MPLKKIGLFGGTFDPLHIGHLIVAEWIWEALKLDKIIFIPNHIHPFHKRQDITPAAERLKMLQLAAKDFPQFSVDPVELERQGVSYTVDTVRYFKKQFPQAEIFLLIGADNWNDFHKWKEPQKIREMAELVVYNRRALDVSASEEKNTIFADSPFIDISSTQIRRRIRSGQAYRSLVPPAVYSYIREQHLYR